MQHGYPSGAVKAGACCAAAAIVAAILVLAITGGDSASSLLPLVQNDPEEHVDGSVSALDAGGAQAVPKGNERSSGSVSTRAHHDRGRGSASRSEADEDDGRGDTGPADIEGGSSLLPGLVGGDDASQGDASKDGGASFLPSELGLDGGEEPSGPEAGDDAACGGLLGLGC